MSVFNTDQRVGPAAAVGRFRPGNYYDRADNNPAGSATMTRYLILATVRGRTPATTANRIMGNTSGAGNGYLMQWTVGGTFPEEFLFRIYDGGGVARSIELSCALAPLRRIIVAGFAYDGAEIRGRTSEGQTAATASAGGYSAGAANSRIGNDNASGFPMLEWVVLAALGSDATARAAADMATDYTTLLENLQNERDLRTGLGFVPSFYWDARDVAAVGGVTGLTWTDRAGALPLTRSGNLEAYGLAARVL